MHSMGVSIPLINGIRGYTSEILRVLTNKTKKGKQGDVLSY